MSGAETFASQAGGTVLGAGALGLAFAYLGKIMLTLIPKSIELYYAKKMQAIEAESENIKRQKETEQLRAENAKLEVQRIDGVIQGLIGQLKLLSQVTSQNSSEMVELRGAIRHIDAAFARIIPYLPKIEKFCDWVDQRRDGPSRGSAESAAPGAMASVGMPSRGVTPSPGGAEPYPKSQVTDLPDGRVRVSETKPPPKKPGTEGGSREG